MGTRGPAPTPTETLKARGSWRAAGRVGEPSFAVEAPECPSWVPELTRDWYREHAESACAAGYMSKPFQTALAGGALWLAEFLEIDKAIREGERTMMTDKGNVLSNPLVTQRKAAWKEFMTICGKYGFTPADKTSLRVGATETKKENGKSRFFKVG